MTPSLKDIARQSKVSFQTVSAVLGRASGNTRVSQKTRDRILRVAHSLNYRRSTAGVGLVTGRTHTLGLITPSLRYPLNAEIAEALQAIVGDYGYGLLVTSLDNHDEDTVTRMKMLAELCVDGIIFQPTESRKDVPCIEIIERYRTPFVVTTEIARPDVSFASFDNYAGARLLTQHILDQGYRHPALITGWSTLSGTPTQVRGFRDVLAERGIDSDRSPVRHQEEFSASAIHATINTLLDADSSLDALLVSDAKVAMHAYGILRNRSIRIGHDCALAAVDDHSWFDSDGLAITCLHYPLDRMARHLVDIVLERMDTPQSPVRQIHLPPTIIVRSSTHR